MKKHIAACLCLLAFGAAVPTRAEPFRTDINPALLYFQSFLLSPDFAPGDRDWLFNTEWRGKKLPDRFGQLVRESDNQFKMVRQAAQATVPCDWGIDMSPGPGTLLPHLARCKAIAQTARLRALWDLQNGRGAEGKDDLLAALAMARNASRDGTLISVLVQIAMEQIVYGAVAEGFHQFSDQELNQFAQALATLPPRGTMSASIKSERVFFYDWMMGKIVTLQKENPADDRKVMSGIEEMFSGVDVPAEGSQQPVNHWGQVVHASGGTSAGIVNLLKEQESLYEKASAILALPSNEYEEQIQPFAAQVEQSKNPFIALTFPALTKARPKELAAQMALAMVQAAIQYRLHGESGLKSIADPCGQGPFALERFVFDGIDRGFALRSAYDGRGFPEMMIFVEKDGPAFQVNGRDAGQAIRVSSSVK